MRALDLLVSVVGLVVLSPLLLLLAIAVKCSSPGPVLHRAQRAGQYGRPFTLYKFRSMVVDAAGAGPRVTGRSDPRVTPVGRLLRRTKLDELPQLYNALIGDMALVGPRPEDPALVTSYGAQHAELLNVKPGITSPATVLHRDEEQMLTGPNVEETYRRDILPAKLEIELDYLHHRTVVEDLRVIARTITAVFGRRVPLGPDRGSQWRS